MSGASTATAIVHEWLPYIEESAHEVFDLMLNGKLQRATPQMLPAPECTAMVCFAGSYRGALILRCGGITANQVAGTLLRLPPERVGHYAADALGEIANMIVGNFKNKVSVLEDRCFLSIPTVVSGMTYVCRSLSSTDPVELWFEFQGQPIQVTLQVQA